MEDTRTPSNRITEYRRYPPPKIGTRLRDVFVGEKTLMIFCYGGFIRETLTPEDPQYDKDPTS